jgi:hypothetical protein
MNRYYWDKLILAACAGIALFFFVQAFQTAVIIMGIIAAVCFFRKFAPRKNPGNDYQTGLTRAYDHLNLRLFAARVRAAEKQAEICVIATPYGVAINDSGNGAWSFLNDGKAALPEPARVQIPGFSNMPDFAALTEPDVQENSHPDIMPVIKDAQTLILYGPQGTGKTTLLCHLIEARMNAGAACVVIDPHGYNDKYPPGIQAAGFGRKYPEIDTVMTNILKEMDNRYNQYNGRNRFSKISVFVDEFTLLYKNCDTVKDFVEQGFTEFRKAEIKFVACVHSITAKFLNLKGGYDMMEGAVIVQLKKDSSGRYAIQLQKEKSGAISAIKNTDGTEKRYRLPGAYTAKNAGGTPVSVPPVTTDTIDTITNFGVAGGVAGGGADTGNNAQNKAEIVRLFNAGESISRIGETVFKTKSGRNNEKVRDVLRNHGIEL